IRDYKGLDLLIEAVNQLDDNYQLLIAGESYGSFDKYTAQIQATRNPKKYKVFNRYISDDEVPAFFSAADVCILPYRSATQSGITSIAYNFDLPLIATNIGGLSENIEKPGVGLMAPEISSESIADTIRSFYEHDRNIFVSNIQKTKIELTWDHFSNVLLSFAKTI
ncbi:MAG: glycosyltransferase, partial [Bacteroidaceae bacterium]